MDDADQETIINMQLSLLEQEGVNKALILVISKLLEQLHKDKECNLENLIGYIKNSEALNSLRDITPEIEGFNKTMRNISKII